MLNKEKGAGSWLTVLPLKSHDYCLNKQEFRDAICLRYGWKIPNTPRVCGCGKPNCRVSASTLPRSYPISMLEDYSMFEIKPYTACISVLIHLGFSSCNPSSFFFFPIAINEQVVVEFNDFPVILISSSPPVLPGLVYKCLKRCFSKASLSRYWTFSATGSNDNLDFLAFGSII